eukprot:scaffold23639_cov65-Phaeocystis_antarctica.AAC.1
MGRGGASVRFGPSSVSFGPWSAQGPRADRPGQGPATLMGKTARDERGCGMGKHIHTEDVERTGHAHDCRSSLAPAAREGLKIKNSGTQWVGGLHRQHQRRCSALDEQQALKQS